MLAADTWAPVQKKFVFTGHVTTRHVSGLSVVVLTIGVVVLTLP